MDGYPNRDSALLPFARHGNLTSHTPGGGTGEPPSRYGAMDRSIKCGVPFGKGGRAVLSHRFGVGDESAEATVEISLIFSRMQDEGARPVAPLRQWLRRTVAGNVENGEAPTLFWERLEIRPMKISTVSSLWQISTRTGASPKATSWRRPFNDWPSAFSRGFCHDRVVPGAAAVSAERRDR